MCLFLFTGTKFRGEKKIIIYIYIYLYVIFYIIFLLITTLKIINPDKKKTKNTSLKNIKI